MIKNAVIHLAKSTLPHSWRLFLRKLNWKRMYFLEKKKHQHAAPVYCPIEGKEYACFIPEKNGIWRSLISPGNGARSRHRLVWLYLKNETSLFQGSATLLHIAPEFCFFQQFIAAPQLNYLPGDKMVKGYGKQSGIEYMDILDLNLPDNSVDYVLCNHVLEHIPDDQKAINEMYRVLKPGGQAIITVPINEKIETTYEDFNITDPREREQHFGQWDHVRWYSTDITKRFEKAGFHAELVRYSSGYSEPDFRKFGLCDDLIVSARKP